MNTFASFTPFLSAFLLRSFCKREKERENFKVCEPVEGGGLEGYCSVLCSVPEEKTNDKLCSIQRKNALFPFLDVSSSMHCKWKKEKGREWRDGEKIPDQ